MSSTAVWAGAETAKASSRATDKHRNFFIFLPSMMKNDTDLSFERTFVKTLNLCLKTR
jgi:hypothetical protein